MNNIIEDAKIAIDQAVALLVVLQNSFAGEDGAPDPSVCADAAAGIVRILKSVSKDLDDLID